MSYRAAAGIALLMIVSLSSACSVQRFAANGLADSLAASGTTYATDDDPQLVGDPLHLGVIMLASLELGYLMPPIGLNLLMSATRFRRPMLEVARATAPMLLVLAVGVALITMFPQLTLALPRWFAARQGP